MRTLFLLIISSSLLLTSAQGQPAGAADDARAILRERFEQRLAEEVHSLNGLFGVVVQDLTTDETFAVNENIVFTQASVIKVPILVELYKQAGEGKISLDQTVPVEESDFVGGSGILRQLTPGQVTMPIRDLAILMIVLSDNTATNMLIDLVGMDNVNRTMEELGFKQTRLQRKMMDSQARLEDRENISTPAEAARLMRMLHLNEILDPAACHEILEILAIPKRGRIVRKLPSGTRVANKTGSVGGVVNDVGIVEVGNRSFTVSAMVSWNADRDDAEEAIADVSYLAYEYFDRLENFNSYGHRK